MRLTLIHNPSAGSGEHSADELRAALWAAGYDVAYQSVKADGLERALDRPADVVLVAGGDGAVAKVAKCLVGRDRPPPLAILPLGTANNIAYSLGLAREARDVIAGLDPDHLAEVARRPLHVGTARAPWATARFVEAAGVGLLAALLRDAAAAARAHREEHPAGRTDEIAAGRRRMRRVLDRARPRHWHVEADGEDLSGEYVMAEVVNTRYVGPHIALAPEGAEDGRLHLALVRESDRRDLDAYLAREVDVEAREDEDEAPVVARPVRCVRLGWHPILGHVDDEPWPDEGGGEGHVDLAIADPPLTVLVPRRSPERA
jgi:diacylglycerol kinase family enzyme